MLLSFSSSAQRTRLPTIHSDAGFGQSRCRPCQLSDLRPSCPEVPEHDVLSEAASIFSPSTKTIKTDPALNLNARVERISLTVTQLVLK